MWTVVTTALSTVLPNIVVVSLLCPIAVAMIRAAGFDDIKTSEPGQIILLAIAYAVSVGGMGTPMGGAMNVTAISALQDYFGIEFMYVDWIKRVIPFLIILTILGCVMVMFMPMKIKRLEGTKEFFREQYAALGPMKKSFHVYPGSNRLSDPDLVVRPAARPGACLPLHHPGLHRLLRLLQGPGLCPDLGADPGEHALGQHDPLRLRSCPGQDAHRFRRQ